MSAAKEKFEWRCPACWQMCEGVGPHSLSLDIAAHIFGHEKTAVAKALKPDAENQTPFDRNFLQSMRISWNWEPPPTPPAVTEITPNH